MTQPTAGDQPADEYVTVAQAATLSGLSARHLQGLLKREVIPGQKPGHDWLVRPSAVAAYLAQRRPPGRPPSSPPADS